MALPKVQHTLYTHKLVGLGKEIKFRPFTNQEQKTLLLAKDAKGTDNEKQVVIDAIEQIISNCTLGKVDASTLPTFDIEDLFLRIRSKSVGEALTVKYRYDYKDQEDRPKSRFVEGRVNIDDIKVKVDPSHSKVIKINDSIGMVMRYPTFKMIEELTDDNDLAIACIDSIYENDEVHDRNSVTQAELAEFYNELETPVMIEVENFFKTMPSISHTLSLDMGDGTQQEVTFKGLHDFFT